MRTFLIGLLVALALAGCSSLTQLGIAPQTTSSASTQIDTQTIFAASSRDRDDEGTYNFGRSDRLSFGTYEISIPTQRKNGTIPSSSAFSGLAFGSENIATQNSISSFSNAILNHTRSNGQANDVLVFVHGFNTTFEISMQRLAQIDHDIDLPSTSILYAWPSSNNLISYIHDLDSTTFAKDGLVELLDGLAASGVNRIIVVGHSLGARLAMEAVRELQITQNQRFFNRLGGVVLLSPDIDLDLFNAQLEKLQDIRAPIIAYLSHEDDTLQRFSNAFNEGKPRLGMVDEVALLQGNKVTLIDVAHVNDPDLQKHLAVAASATMIAAINAMSKPDLIGYANSAKNGDIPNAIITKLGDSVHVLLSQY